MLRHLRTGRDQPACALIKTLFRPRGHAWLPVAAVPGSWISRQAAGACPSGSPFHPSFIPGVTRGGVVFPPTSEAVLARPGIAGPPRFGKPWNPSLPAPATVLRALEARRRLGLFQDSRFRNAASKSELVLDLPQPCRLSSRRRPAAGWPSGRVQTQSAPQPR